MGKSIRFILLMLAGLVAGSAQARIAVLATTADWGSLTTELGGEKVDVYVATNALQDVHQVDAKPSLIARARKADLVVATGAELEVGWLPVLLQESGNTNVRPGAPGYFAATAGLRLLEVPTAVDRAQGDVHPDGNPHVQLDPRNIAKVAVALAARLAQLDAPNAKIYDDRLQSFQGRWTASIQKWEQQTQPLKGVAVVAHHKNMTYLWNWLGLREVGTLEPKPGVEPSAGHLSELNAQLARQPAKLVVRSAYEDARASQWLADHAGIKAIALPFTVGGNDKATDLFGLFDSTVALLLGGAQ